MAIPKPSNSLKTKRCLKNVSSATARNSRDYSSINSIAIYSYGCQKMVASKSIVAMAKN